MAHDPGSDTGGGSAGARDLAREGQAAISQEERRVSFGVPAFSWLELFSPLVAAYFHMGRSTKSLLHIVLPRLLADFA